MKIKVEFSPKALKYLSNNSPEALIFAAESIIEPCLLIFNPIILTDPAKIKKLRADHLQQDSGGNNAAEIDGSKIIDVEIESENTIDDKKIYDPEDFNLKFEFENFNKTESGLTIKIHGLFARKFLDKLKELKSPLVIDLKGVIQKKFTIKQITPIVINTCAT